MAVATNRAASHHPNRAGSDLAPNSSRPPGRQGRRANPHRAASRLLDRPLGAARHRPVGRTTRPGASSNRTAARRSNARPTQDRLVQNRAIQNRAIQNRAGQNRANVGHRAHPSAPAGANHRHVATYRHARASPGGHLDVGLPSQPVVPGRPNHQPGAGHPARPASSPPEGNNSAHQDRAPRDRDRRGNPRLGAARNGHRPGARSDRTSRPNGQASSPPNGQGNRNPNPRQRHSPSPRSRITRLRWRSRRALWHSRR
ncbi:hypothetical protein EV191_1011378 [Tamaricihabitans halophyticus]|uniref:Uncharacterized protein n=1 Tax=Tamaricihabitans halophyticus TaxID=1262583 RepID=A0A4R2R4C1_9PSEU|nr:hypothetical protein EV191_1011378 [Tamaricihabitans halophyticus]